MLQPWNIIKKQLEQDLLCEKLRGRVQYFLTVHEDNDSEACGGEYGSFAVHVDGEEIIRIHPVNEIEESDHDERLIIPKSVKAYLNLDVRGNITDGESIIRMEDPIMRMLVILDRRVGRRTLQEVADTILEQPLWLQVMYRLRFDVEGIRSAYDQAGMKRVLLSADSYPSVYLVPEEVADHLEAYCLEFACDWLRTEKRAKKYRVGGTACYSETDFIEYLNKYKFPDKPSVFIETVKIHWDGDENDLPLKYRQLEWFNF